MNEVKTPKKPLIFYYCIALLVVLLICWVHLYRRRIRPNLVCRQAAA